MSRWDPSDLRTRLIHLHGDLREAAAQHRWKGIVWAWSTVTHRLLYVTCFRFKVFGEALRVSAGAVRFNKWRQAAARLHHQEALAAVAECEQPVGREDDQQQARSRSRSHEDP